MCKDDGGLYNCKVMKDDNGEHWLIISTTAITLHIKVDLVEINYATHVLLWFRGALIYSLISQPSL